MILYARFLCPDSSCSRTRLAPYTLSSIRLQAEGFPREDVAASTSRGYDDEAYIFSTSGTTKLPFSYMRTASCSRDSSIRRDASMSRTEKKFLEMVAEGLRA